MPTDTPRPAAKPSALFQAYQSASAASGQAEEARGFILLDENGDALAAFFVEE